MSKQHRNTRLISDREHIDYEMDIASALTEFLNQCWYEEDNNPLHEEGICSRCDWTRQARESYG